LRKKIFRKLSLVFVPPIIYIVMRLLWFTYRKKYHYIDEPIEGQCMAITWHGELLVAPQAYRHLRKKQLTSAIIAQHHDGELIARTLKMLNILPLRGSSRRGAKAVLIQAIKVLKEGYSVMITPDGPKGPQYSMSDGAVALALRAKLPLMVINYKPTHYWQLGSWDKFLIPKPFSSVEIYHQVLDVEGMPKEEAKAYLQEQMRLYSIS
jgi:lysophospholipid acyltransferase (LPLAT)-like uncharacterized protein